MAAKKKHNSRQEKAQGSLEMAQEKGQGRPRKGKRAAKTKAQAQARKGKRAGKKRHKGRLEKA